MNLEQLLQDADRRLVQQNVKFEQQLIAMKDRIEAAQGASLPRASSLDPGADLHLHPSLPVNGRPYLQHRPDRQAHPWWRRALARRHPAATNDDHVGRRRPAGLVPLARPRRRGRPEDEHLAEAPVVVLCPLVMTPFPDQ